MLKRKPMPSGGINEPTRTARRLPAGPRLLWQADAVLALAVQLRATGSVTDLPKLRARITAILADFQTRARGAGVESGRAAQAAEILAALIDHSVASMPWGADAGWKSVSPSATRKPGLRPAQRLLEIARASAGDSGLRELLGVALLLGFDKRSLGPDEPPITHLITQLSQSPEPPRQLRLTPDWKGGVGRPAALANWLPFWVWTCVIAAVMAITFFGLAVSLGSKSDQAYAALASLNWKRVMPEHHPLASTPRLAGLLSEQVVAGQLLVRDEVDRSYIIVSDRNLFESGGEQLRSDSAPLLRAIAHSLQSTPGRIQVIGHTGTGTERSARYPSDWDLSVNRARVIQQALRNQGIEAARIAYDGQGSVAATAADEIQAAAGSGRIEILLLAGR